MPQLDIWLGLTEITRKLPRFTVDKTIANTSLFGLQTMKERIWYETAGNFSKIHRFGDLKATLSAMYQYIALYGQPKMYSECRSTTESYHSIAETHWYVSTGPKRTENGGSSLVLPVLLVQCFLFHYPNNSDEDPKLCSAQPSCSWLMRKAGSKTKPCRSPTICWLMVRCWYYPYHIFQQEQGI